MTCNLPLMQVVLMGNATKWVRWYIGGADEGFKITVIESCMTNLSSGLVVLEFPPDFNRLSVT